MSANKEKYINIRSAIVLYVNKMQIDGAEAQYGAARRTVLHVPIINLEK